ncbi:MAG: hypothetical protein CVU69_10350 [Deltaproteobacteria bacterium HGW-Deltaproteobacteria-4]|nr:MAG: hypothetical protein CVU69_10350 [Deltaproteobacteria bacterium HGW-Deltaproteobacteria-4]
MKKLTVLLAAALLFAGATSALAEIKVEGSASVGVFSDYIWRGANFTGDANMVVQPSVTVGTGGFSVNWWGNMNENTGELDEVDFTLDYSTELGPLAVSVGNILYNVDGASDTNEVYLAVAPTTLPLDLKLTYFYDYDEFEVSYLILALGKSFDIADKTSLSVGAAAGYFDFDYLNNAELSASLSYAINDQLAITPSVLYSTPISDEAKDALDDEVVAGLTVALSF